MTPRRRPVEPRCTDEDAVAVITGLFRAESVVVNALNENFRRFGITPAGFNVLMILEGADEALCPHEIGERRLVTRGTVTGVVDSLARADLVRRTRHPTDRRMQLVEITDAGRGLLTELLPDHRQVEATLLGSLSPAERRQLAELLQRVGI